MLLGTTLPPSPAALLHCMLTACDPAPPPVQYGIVRDVIQNHLLQILALFAMEQPVSAAVAESAAFAALLHRLSPCYTAPSPPLHCIAVSHWHLCTSTSQASLDAEDIRNEKVKVLKSMQQVGCGAVGWPAHC